MAKDNLQTGYKGNLAKYTGAALGTVGLIGMTLLGTGCSWKRNTITDPNGTPRIDGWDVSGSYEAKDITPFVILGEEGGEVKVIETPLGPVVQAPKGSQIKLVAKQEILNMQQQEKPDFVISDYYWGGRFWRGLYYSGGRGGLGGRGGRIYLYSWTKSTRESNPTRSQFRSW